MSKNENNSNDVVLSDSIFTPVMDVKAATQGFKEFQRLKMEILQPTDIVEIMGKSHVCKSGWNKLALFFGVSTRTVSSKKTHNPDGSFEFEVTVEAYKKNKEGIELFNVQRSALVSSLEKEKTPGQKNSPRKAHDVFASAETRAEGRALAAFFGSGEVSAEEMAGTDNTPSAAAQEQAAECGCSMNETIVSDVVNGKGLHQCEHCKKPISEIRYKAIEKIHEAHTS